MSTVNSVVSNTAAAVLYSLAPVMCERIKRRTVCNESGNSWSLRERDVNYSCKTGTNLPAEVFHRRAGKILPTRAYMKNDMFLC